MSERGTRETPSEPNPESRVDSNVQIVAAMQQMTDLLAHMVQHQGHNPNPPVGKPRESCRE